MNKNHYFSLIRLICLLSLVCVLLSYVTKGQAQSVQDWSDPINLSISGAASNPSMVVDGNGVIHVIWADKFDGYKYTQSADGITWTAPVTVKFPFSPKAPPPVMLSDANGVIHIFWLNDKYTLSYAQALPDDLDKPTFWRAKTNLDTTIFDFDASVDHQGKIHVVYLKNPSYSPDTGNTIPTPVSPGTAGVFYKGSSIGGTWSSETLLYESPYFRSLGPDNAHIRMAVSDKAEEARVYAVWDDRAQKRIFIASSSDGGLNWGQVKEMVAPQANLGYQTPYNADIDILDEKVLTTWFVGNAGSNCVPYSWSSEDGGETWGEQTPIFPNSAQCPEKSEFIPVDPSYSVELFTVDGNLSLIAWNGKSWSDPELQMGPSSIINPATFEPVSLGCERVAPYANRLLVVGCDQSTGGDVWYLERKLDSLDYLFPLPTQWSGDAKIISTQREISSLTSISDDAGNAHAVWVQSPTVPADVSSPLIQYSRWKGSEWTRPSSIFSKLDGQPLNLSLRIDSQKRLLLSWVNQKTGEIMFSWSNAMQANVPQEWRTPLVVIAPSMLTNSPDMLVDAADRIVIAYAITLNEDRGIYVIQSTDLGETWSSPVKVFDAVAAGWEMVDQPKLAVTDDGTLHILFTKYNLMGETQPAGLYYSRSSDGGTTWTPVDVVSEQPVQWSKLIAYQGSLHRLWQEKNRLATQINHQVSQDGGESWDAATRIPSDADANSKPDVSIDGTGKLHYLQVVGQDQQVFEEWEWNNGHWQSVENRKFAAVKLSSPPAVDSGITSAGDIYSLLQFEQAQEDGVETDIWSIHRSLDMADPVAPITANIPTPSTTTVTEPAPIAQVTGTPISAFAGVTDERSPINRNFIGLGLVGIVALLILVFVVPNRGKTQDKTKK
jgi:hypothetical protein